MPMFNKAKMNALSPLNPPTGFGGGGINKRFGANKKQKKVLDNSSKSKLASGFMNSFGKK